MNPGITLHTAALALLETAINQALRLDPATQAALAALEGKCLHLSLLGPELDFFLLPARDGVSLRSIYEGPVDTTVTGTPADFVELFTADDAGAALINGNIRLTGDSKVLLALQATLHRLELDWEAELARLVGDIPAHELGKIIRGGWRVGRGAADSLLRQLEEYIHEEGRLLPPRAEIEAFYHDVQDLALRVDRLTARVERLQRRR